MTTTTIAIDSSANVGADSQVGAEHTFRSFDGTELFYRSWRAAGAGVTPAPTQAVILFHRGHEHSGRFENLVRDLRLPAKFAVFAWDARGHGRSPGERGYAKSFSDVVRDVDEFVRHVSRGHGIAISEIAVVGHSVGAVAVAAWVHDYAPAVRAVVLATPALRVKLYVPLAMPALRLRNALLPGKGFVKSYVRGSMLTHDPREAEAYANDPLISRNIAVNILLDVYDTSTRLIADAGAIVAPTLVMTAGSDWVVKNGPTQRFFERLSSPLKRMKHYDGYSHAIFHERDRARPIADLRDFLREVFANPARPKSLIEADERGFTHDEFARLSKPRAITCPKTWSFAMQRFAMNTVCRLSKGVRIGWRTGFDSGESLDHVYRNRAEGITPLGKLIDRFYLNAIGWRGIRQRKVHLQAALRALIAAIRASGASVTILDVAAGPGRYLLEVLAERQNDPNVRAILRDRSETGLEAGRAIARELGVVDRVTYEIGDAFSAESIASVAPKPNIVIVSGLYELFPGNAMVRESLRGIAQVIEPGGRLIYTGQPWHPQIEMIARVLPNRDGKPWVMRRRTQAELDQLVQSSGFEKIQMQIDRWGIFTVSVARKC